MPCPACGRKNTKGVKFCAFCGKAQEDPSGESQGSLDLDRTVREAESKIDQLFDEASEAAEKACSEINGLLSAKGESSSTAHSELEEGCGDTSSCPDVAKGEGDKRFLLHENEVVGFLFPVPEQIHQAFEMVVSSPHVTTNAVYSQLLKNVRFYFDAGNPEVNAFASHGEVQLSSGEVTKAPCIVIFGGMGCMTQVMAAALGLWSLSRERNETYMGNTILREVAVRLGEEVVKGGGTFADDTMAEIYGETVFPDGAFDRLAGSGHLSSKDTWLVSRARSYSMAMTMSTIAHEIGHIALGHTLGKTLNYDISRNEERAADGFASSVLSSSPFSDYLVTGQFMSWVLMAWVDYTAASGEATTHPLARERLESVLRDNSAAARDVGLSKKTLGKWLPPEERR